MADTKDGDNDDEDDGNVYISPRSGNWGGNKKGFLPDSCINEVVEDNEGDEWNETSDQDGEASGDLNWNWFVSIII